MIIENKTEGQRRLMAASEATAADPSRLATLMRLGELEGPLWPDAELSAILRLQVGAPFSRVVGQATGRRAGSVWELLTDPSASADDLADLKNFAKFQRHSDEATIPVEVATLLYYLSIAAAFVRCGKRISTMSDVALAGGLQWVARQTWPDQRVRDLASTLAAQIAAG